MLTTALLLPMILSACATAPVTAPQQTAEQMAPRQYQSAINLSGRLSVQYQQNDRDEAVHGNFNWDQTKDLTTINLLSPLGQTLASIKITPTQSTLTQAGSAPRSAADVDALTLAALGWPLPVSGLQHWLQGFAVDANGQPFVASPDNAVVVTKDGWHIHFVSWQDDVQNRPKRIDLSRTTTQAGEVSMRFVIDQWQAH